MCVCSHLYAHVCALVHTYKHVCLLCMFCVFTEKSRKQAGCLRELEWTYKPLVSWGSDTLAQPVTELMLECHFYRNGDLWQTGLNKSHMVSVSPSVTAHRQFSIHLGWSTLRGVWARHLFVVVCTCTQFLSFRSLVFVKEHKQLFLQWSGVLPQLHVRLSQSWADFTKL